MVISRAVNLMPQKTLKYALKMPKIIVYYMYKYVFINKKKKNINKLPNFI
jgi:hypothetical protein